jgi:membrane-associated protease RseP (regulator of RpoE activity)
VLAFVLFMTAGMLTDEDPPPPRRIAEVDKKMENAPAVGKVEAGDEFVAINGEPLHDKEFAKEVHRLGGQTITFQVRRKDAPEASFVVPGGHLTRELVAEMVKNGELEEVEMKPVFFEFEGRYAEGFEKYVKTPDALTALLMGRRNAQRWRIGIIFEQELPPRQNVGIGTAAKAAFLYPIRQTEMILTGLKEWITGKADGEVGSVVRITSEVKKAIEQGWIVALLLLMVLNVYLGLFNLFPLPALDGGRLVFLTYEMVTRRRANPKLEATIHMAGVLVLAVLLVVVTVNDCRSL